MPRSKLPKSERHKYKLHKKRSKESYKAKTPEAHERKIYNLKFNMIKRGEWPPTKIPKVKISKDIIKFAEKEFLVELLYQKIKPTLALLGTPKKCGKSTLAAIVALFLLCSKKFAEIYIVGPDLEQSTLVVYSKIRTSLRLNKELHGLCKIGRKEIVHRETGSFIRPLACSSTNAGLNPTLCVFDELWRFNTQEAVQAYDELTNIPSKDNLNLIVTYAGYAEDEGSILYGIYKKGIDQAEGREDRDKQFLFRWYGEELYSHIPWVTKNYLTLQRSRLRPNTYARLHQNEWVSGTESFISSTILDDCTHNHRKGMSFDGKVCLGVDIGLKHDCSAVVVVGRVPDKDKSLILIDHSIFIPDAKHHQIINLEQTIERDILRYNDKYKIQAVLYDPYQFARSAATLKNAHIRMVEFPQTVGNTCEMTEALSTLLQNHCLLLYPDKTIRQHLLNARVKETQRGWRLVKGRKSKKIDLDIALAMAVLGAQQKLLLKSGKKGSIYIGESGGGGESHTGNEMFESMVKASRLETKSIKLEMI
ncbi:MAG: terminase TerL endonuclease subunit [Sedimentisphaerales bacterium]